MSKSDKIKEIVKGKFGTNPFDPWSTKANIAESETVMLKKFLLSRGINPEFVSKDQKIAHSKTGQFAKWKQSHLNDVTESITTEPTPVQKRASELSTSKGKHKEVRTGAGTHEKLHSESEQIDEISRETTHSYFKKNIAQTGGVSGKKPDDMSKEKYKKRGEGYAREIGRAHV